MVLFYVDMRLGTPTSVSTDDGWTSSALLGGVWDLCSPVPSSQAWGVVQALFGVSPGQQSL